MSRASIILLLSFMPMLASVQAVLTAADAAYEMELALLAEPFDYEAHLTRCWACAEAKGLTAERASVGIDTVGRFCTPAGGFARSDVTLPIDVRLCFRRQLMEEQLREASENPKQAVLVHVCRARPVVPTGGSPVSAKVVPPGYR